MDKVSLGNKIKEARLKKGVTQQELSRIADINEMYLSEIEHMKKETQRACAKMMEEARKEAEKMLSDAAR